MSRKEKSLTPSAKRQAAKRAARATNRKQARRGAAATQQGGVQLQREAMGRLIGELGEPINADDVSRKGSKVYIFSLCDSGEEETHNGIAVVRMSADDLKKGDTAYAQWTVVKSMLDERSLEARWLVVTVNNSGARPFDDRVDFEVIIRGLRQGWCEFVAYRDLQRVARDLLSGEVFMWLLRDTDTALHVTDFNHAIDWDNDELYLRILAILGIEERKRLLQRTSNAHEVTWLGQGFGYKGCEPFSIERNPEDRSMYQSARLGRAVLDMFRTYTEHERGNDNGCKAVQAMLENRYGITMRKNRVLEVLANPFYLHGDLSVEYNGKAYDCNPVRLQHPVPLDLFEAVQGFLHIRQRGAYREAAPGQFIGNSIWTFHRDCRGARAARGQPIRLRGRMQSGKDIGYGHYPTAPGGRADRSGCSYAGPGGGRIDTAEYESTLVRALLAAAEQLPEGFDFTDEERERLQESIAQLERQLEQSEDDFFEAQLANPKLGFTDYDNYTGAINRRLHRLRKRERVGDSLSRLPRRSPVGATREELLAAMHEVLTEEMPADPVHAVRRKLIVEACLSAVEVWRDKTGTLQVKLEGPIVPEAGQEWEEPIWPLQAARVFLEQHLLEKLRSAKAKQRKRAAQAAGVLDGDELVADLKQGLDRHGNPLSPAVQTVAHRYQRATVCTDAHRRRTGMVKADLPVVRTPRERPETLVPGKSAWIIATDDEPSPAEVDDVECRAGALDA